MTAGAARYPGSAAATRNTDFVGPPDDLLNAQRLEELRGMGPVVAERILPRYMRNAAEAGAAIAAAASRDDPAEVAILAHKLCGGSGTLAGVRLPATCAALEEAARRGDLATMRTIAGTVPDLVAATCQALRAALS